MPVALSIKDCPEELVERLSRRAARHNHTVDAEVVAILEASLGTRRRLTISELAARARASGLRTPADSAAIVREARDARCGR